jgi:hypothetical protein
MDTNLIVQSLRDFFSPKIFMTSVYSLLITLFIAFGSLYFAFDGFSALRDEFFLFIDGESWLFLEGLKENFIIDFLIKHAIFSIILNFLFLLGFGLVIYYIFFMIYSFVIGLFTGVVVSEIKNKYYENTVLNGFGVGATIWFYIKTVLITVGLFLLLVPFYFIPVFNLLIFLPMYYFFHRTLTFDVSSIVNTKEEYEAITAKNWSGLKIRTFICFLIALVPIVGIVLYPFYIIYVSHFVLNETNKIRAMS